jgi:hypothetical protein
MPAKRRDWTFESFPTLASTPLLDRLARPFEVTGLRVYGDSTDRCSIRFEFAYVQQVRLHGLIPDVG